MLELIAAIIISMSFAAPTPIGSPADWINGSDYPYDAQRKNEQGTTEITLAVDSNGVPVSCTATISSGFKDLDYATCALLLSRAKFHPAHLADGTAVAGTYRSKWRWGIGAADKSSYLGDLEVFVKALKKSHDGHAFLSVDLLIDKNGVAQQCTAQSSKENPELEVVACSQARPMFRPQSLATVPGGQGSTVQMMNVIFTSQEAR